MPLKLVRRPKTPHWVMRGTVRGLSIEESTRTGDRKAAERIRIRRENALLDQSIEGSRAVVTFEHAAESYMIETRNTRFLAPIIRHFAGKLLASIRQAEIDRMAGKLYPGASPATINRQAIGPAVAVLRHASRKEWCDRPIIARRKEPAGRIRWLTHAEADALIDAAADHLKPLLIFYFLTGARVSEGLYLDWSQVDLGRGHATFLKTKNGDARGVALAPRLVAALANLPHREGAVFRRPDGEPYERRESDSGGQIKTAFKGACRRAGITNFTPHDCRHTWASWHYAENRDLLTLQRVGGWKTIQMVQRYAHIDTGPLGDTVRRLSWGKSGETSQATEKKLG